MVEDQMASARRRAVLRSKASVFNSAKRDRRKFAPHFSKLLVSLVPIIAVFGCSKSADNVVTITKQVRQISAGYVEHSWNHQFEQQYRDVNFIVITSKTDHLMLTSVIVNRGHCKFGGENRLPAKLDFGQTLQAMAECNPVEIELQTDRGNFTVSWTS